MPAPKGNQYALGNKGGRPTKYDPKYAKLATRACLLGASDEVVADLLEVDAVTIWRWRATHEEFCKAFKVGAAEADDIVERSLFMKAVGYQHDAVKIFHQDGQTVQVPYKEKYAPDTAAAIFWLKNRRSDRWKDKQEVEVSGDSFFTALEKARRRVAQAETE